jgi:hypothetical protein
MTRRAAASGPAAVSRQRHQLARAEARSSPSTVGPAAAWEGGFDRTPRRRRARGRSPRVPLHQVIVVPRSASTRAASEALPTWDITTRRAVLRIAPGDVLAPVALPLHHPGRRGALLDVTRAKPWNCASEGRGTAGEASGKRFGRAGATRPPPGHSRKYRPRPPRRHGDDDRLRRGPRAPTTSADQRRAPAAGRGDGSPRPAVGRRASRRVKTGGVTERVPPAQKCEMRSPAGGYVTGWAPPPPVLASAPAPDLDLELERRARAPSASVSQWVGAEPALGFRHAGPAAGGDQKLEKPDEAAAEGTVSPACPPGADPSAARGHGWRRGAARLPRVVRPSAVDGPACRDRRRPRGPSAAPRPSPVVRVPEQADARVAGGPARRRVVEPSSITNTGQASSSAASTPSRWWPHGRLRQDERRRAPRPPTRPKMTTC